MRSRHLAPLLLLFLSPLPTFAADGVVIEKVIYNGWPGAWRISNESCELVIVPQVTRVMRFALRGGKNVLWENPDLAGKTFPADDGAWHNIGGEKLWPTQQKDLFKKYTGKDGWPPPYPWDAGASQAERIDNGVRLTIPHDPRFGADAVREFLLDPREPRVHVRQWIEKTKGEPAEMTVWTVCQVDDPVVAMLPDASTDVGFRRLGDDHGHAHTVATGVVLDRDARDGVKIGVIAADRPINTGWVATTFANKAPAKDGAGGGVLFVQSHRAQPDATYPDDGCQAELYQAPVSFAKYSEMELLSPLIALKPGERLRDDAIWQLLPVDDQTVKNADRAGTAAANAHRSALRLLEEPRPDHSSSGSAPR
jgi:hypothetical protein